MKNQINFLQIVFFAAAAVSFSGCVSVKKDAPFLAHGKVADSYGNPVVLNSKQNIQLCVKAEYVSDTGNAGSASECSDIVTDQNGNYNTRMLLQIESSQADKTVDIKNAKIYGQKYDSTHQRYYYFSVSVVQSNVNENGGNFTANMSVFSLD